jgi:hypothetical protein
MEGLEAIIIFSFGIGRASAVVGPMQIQMLSSTLLSFRKLLTPLGL